jgi:hypothetical protein
MDSIAQSRQIQKTVINTGPPGKQIHRTQFSNSVSVLVNTTMVVVGGAYCVGLLSSTVVVRSLYGVLTHALLLQSSAYPPIYSSFLSKVMS